MQTEQHKQKDKIALLPDIDINFNNQKNIATLQKYNKIYIISKAIKQGINKWSDFKIEIQEINFSFDEYDKYCNDFLENIFRDSLPLEISLLARSLKTNIYQTYKGLFSVLYMLTLIKEKSLDIITSDRDLVKCVNSLNASNIVAKRLNGKNEKINFVRLVQLFWFEWYIKHIANLIKINKNVPNIKSLLNTDFECYLYDVNNSSVIDKLHYHKSQSKNRKLCLISDYRLKGSFVNNNNEMVITFTDLFSKSFIFKYIKNYFQLNKNINKNIFYDKMGKFAGFNIANIISLNKTILFLSLAKTEIFYYNRFIKKFMPSKINTASGLHSRSYLFILASRKYSIETNTIQHGMPIARPGFIPTETDKIFCWGLGKDIIKNWGINNTASSNYLDEKYIDQHENDNKQFILFTLHTNYFINQNIGLFISHIAATYKEEKIIIRPHPGTGHIPKSVLDLTKYYENIFLDKESEIYNSIISSKIVVTFFSSIIGDAILFNKKIIIINHTSIIYPKYFSDVANIIFVNKPNEISL